MGWLDEYRPILSGERTDAAAACLRAGLWVVQWPYAVWMAARNLAFDRGWLAQESTGVPVISVGNLTTGGAGKTPVVLWIARWLRRQGVRVHILSRGYGAEAGGSNDEARELEQLLPDVPHLQNPNRLEAARIAVEELACQLILLDDACQHRQIARDLEIVLLDATCPFGYDALLPRGLLREPLAGLARADLIVLTRADLVEATERERIRRTAAEFAPEAQWLEAAHRPRQLRNARGATRDLSWLRQTTYAAFCGLGNPDGFWGTLRSVAEPVAVRSFPDHHAYSRADVEELGRWAASLGVARLICTTKDLVKLETPRLGPAELWAMAAEIEFTHGESLLTDRLEALVASVDLS